MQTTAWIATRFLLPLLAAGLMVYGRWGMNNVAYILTPPIFFLLLRMYIASRERPICPPLEDFPPFRSMLAWWNVLEVFGLVLLMGFEIAIAAAAEGRDQVAALIVLVIFGAPYAILVVAARSFLRRAKQLAEECQAILTTAASPDASSIARHDGFAN